MAKILAIALIGGISSVILKSFNSDLSVFVAVTTGIILIFSTFSYLTDTFSIFKKISEIGKIDSTLIKLCLKVTVLGYAVEFGASTLEDFGLNSLSNKLVFAGKLVILSVSLPVFYALINVFTALLK